MPFVNNDDKECFVLVLDDVRHNLICDALLESYYFALQEGMQGTATDLNNLRNKILLSRDKYILTLWERNAICNAIYPQYEGAKERGDPDAAALLVDTYNHLLDSPTERVYRRTLRDGQREEQAR
jgi:hypothetical protein